MSAGGYWAGRPTLVTGGASFIGSHLVEALVARGAAVRVADNFSSGRLENIAALVHAGAVDLVEGDLLDRTVACRAAHGMQAVFHLAAEHVHDGTAVNLGTTERTSVIECAREVLRYTGHRATIELHPEMPTGPLNRIAANALAGQLLGWRPGVRFLEGLHRTIDWYFATKNRQDVAVDLSVRLLERRVVERVPGGR